MDHSARAPVRSFDLFDTLLGRLHHRPDSIFDLVERHFPFPGFAFFRKAAEYKSDRTLPDIYRHFQQLTEISETQSSALMQCEFQTELQQIFPIVENLDLVQDGDLIVTDTYYDTHQVRQILEKIGLRRQVFIYASPGGKSSGVGWDVIRGRHSISSHLGDNPHSDVAMATSRGISASHYSGSQLSPHEKAVMKMGQGELAHLMRALRLQNPYPPQSPEHSIWNDQCQLNVPLLIEACLYLDSFCREHSKKRILFTARDGCLWIQLFRRLYPEYDAIYFHTSRYTYTLPTPSFIEYVRSVYTDDTAIVDSHGKGRTCEKFFTTHFKTHPTYLSIVNPGRKHHAIVRKRDLQEPVEKINYDLVGALYDVQDGKPLRAEPEFDLRFIRPSHECIKKCVELIPHFTPQTFDRRVVTWALKTMESGLNLDKYIRHAFQHCHISQGKGHPLRHVHLLRNGLTINDII